MKNVELKIGLPVTYTLAEVDTSKEIDVLKVYNLASKIG